MRVHVRLRVLVTVVLALLASSILRAGFAEQDAIVPNPAAPGVTLAGTLSIPGGEGKFPALLLISGAGPQDRDSTTAGHKPFLVLSSYLTRHGFAVLRFDDRGTGQSTGKFDSATTADFATDAESELQYLRSRPEIDPARVGVLGHGEGAIIAAMLASKDPKIAFAVLLACPAVSGLDVLVEQTREAESVSGLPQEQIDNDAEIGLTLYKMAAEGRSEQELASALKKLSRKLPAFDAQSWNTQIPRLTNPWLRYFLNYNPAAALERVNCPVLALYGERDLQVLPEQNAPELELAFKRAHNKRVTILVLPRLNYLFQTAKTGLGSEYAIIPEDMSESALHDISHWLSRTVLPGEPALETR